MASRRDETASRPVVRSVVRAAQEGDRDAWSELFVAYCACGGVTAEVEHLARVWAWLSSPGGQTRCLVAQIDGALVGFTHFREFERPMMGTKGLYVDDLYVDPVARGRGVATLLLEEVRRSAGRDGYDVVRWTTGTSNLLARAVYDHVAATADVVVYNAEPLA